MKLWFLSTFCAVLVGCAAPQFASSVCEIDGGAQAGVPLSLTASFGFSGCASRDAFCTATVDGGAIVLDTSATICSTGSNPGGVLVSAPCSIPPLEPGSYQLVPFSRTLVVVADGGGATSCPF